MCDITITANINTAWSGNSTTWVSVYILYLLQSYCRVPATMLTRETGGSFDILRPFLQLKMYEIKPTLYQDA